MMRANAAALAVAVVLAAGPAAAQGFNMSQNNTSEIQVYADDGIEWVSDANRVIARGNAKAVRGTVTVTADTLTAYYRNGQGGNAPGGNAQGGGGQGGGGNEIWRIDADGNVTIATPTETATGNKATYDLDKAIFVLRGTPSKLVTPTDTVTAKDTLEYWERERMAVARGDALATTAEKSIKADVLTAHFKDKGGPAGPTGGAGASAAKGPAAPAAKGKARAPGGSQGGDLELQRADAYGHVVLTTPKEQVTGDRGDYNLESGIATVSGSVKLTRDGNELNGGYAHVNLNTGISKLFGAAPGDKGGDTRARGTFIPEKPEGGEKRRPMFKGQGPNSDAASGGR